MSVDYVPKIMGIIEARKIQVGKGVVVEQEVLITGIDGPADSVTLGDFSYIGRNTRIIVPEFRLGDYSKLHAFSFLHGEKPLQIGRNCWIGGNTVLDSMGGLDLADNVGIGAHSQIWTHIQFGDIVEGCRFFSRKYMCIRQDAWFVGHCVVSPVHVGEKSMAMLGSVITKDMLSNHIYAGVPAKDVTDRMGCQFEYRSVEQKVAQMQELIDAFVTRNPKYRGQLVAIRSRDERRGGLCWFDVSERTYNKTYSEAEVSFLKAHTPLIKFTPAGEPPFINWQEADDSLADDIPPKHERIMD